MRTSGLIGGIAGVATIHFSGGHGLEGVAFLVLGCLVLAVVLVPMGVVLPLWYRRNPSKFRRKLAWFGVACAIVGVLCGVLLGLVMGDQLSRPGDFIWAFLAALAGFLPYFGVRKIKSVGQGDE